MFEPRIRHGAWSIGILFAAAACGGAADPGPQQPTPPAPAPTDLPQAAASAAPTADAPSDSTPPEAPPDPFAGTTFPPPSVEPLFERTAQPDDGQWKPLPTRAGEDRLYTTKLHLHPIQKWVEVEVVAIDRKRVALHLVAGIQEPESKEVPAERRTGLIDPTHLPNLLAAFNGGFKATHGKYGMRIGEDQYLPFKDDACSIGHLPDDGLLIGEHSAIESELEAATWVRQTPPCLVDEGELHPLLMRDTVTKKWGAAEGGKVDIRRSAIGVSEDGRTLFFAIGEWVTAQHIARAMQHAGAVDAAELDINYSFTRFTLYADQPDGSLKASSPLLKELKFTQKGYIESPAHRDFFYLTGR